MRMSKGGVAAEALPPDTYIVSYQGFEEGKTWENTRSDGSTYLSTTMRILLTVEDGEYRGEDTSVFMPQYYSDKSKTGRMWKAIMGLDANASLPDEFDEADFIGRKFKATLGVKENGYQSLDAAIALAAPRARKPAKPEGWVSAPEDDAEPNF